MTVMTVVNCFHTFLPHRLETLQQIANRVQRDCVNGEDKLALARTALQSVSYAQSVAIKAGSDNICARFEMFEYFFLRMLNVWSLGSSSSMRLRLLDTFWSVRISSDNK